jgi:anti-sigma regulatory factor (Ser/Thr protein kinase)
MVASKEGEIRLEFRLWHQELRNILIDQGLQGYKQDALEKYFKNKVTKEDLRAYLELLLKEDKVQKFRYAGKYWWRATRNILDDEV